MSDDDFVTVTEQAAGMARNAGLSGDQTIPYDEIVRLCALARQGIDAKRALSDSPKWIAASERKPTAADLPIVFRQAGSRDHYCIDWPSELERVLNPRHENDRIIGLWFPLPKPNGVNGPRQHKEDDRG